MDPIKKAHICVWFLQTRHLKLESEPGIKWKPSSVQRILENQPYLTSLDLYINEGRRTKVETYSKRYFVADILRGMKQLEHLYLREPARNIDQMSELLSAICKHRNLKTLSILVSKMLTGRPSEILGDLLAQGRLETLRLNDTSLNKADIKAISQGLSIGHSLRVLKWEFLKPREPDALLYLGLALKSNTQLINLKICYGRGLTYEQMTPLMEFISQSEKLHRLSCKFQSFERDIAGLIASHISKNSSLLKIKFDLLDMKEDSYTILTTGALKCKSLQSLSLVFESVPRGATLEFAEMVKSNENLKHLKMLFEGDADSKKRIFENIVASKSLESFSLHSKMGIQNANIIRSLANLPNDSKLNKINLRQLKTNRNILNFIENFLEKTKVETICLIIINFGDSNDSDIDESVGKGLRLNQKLKSLTLPITWVKHGAILDSKIISEGLINKEKLEYIDLSGSVFADASQQNLHQIIVSNHMLQVLKLNGCHINNNAGIRIGRAIQDHPSLGFVDLERNEIGINGISVFIKAKQLNVKLKHINLADNQFQNLFIKDLMEQLLTKSRVLKYSSHNRTNSSALLILFLKYLFTPNGYEKMRRFLKSLGISRVIGFEDKYLFPLALPQPCIFRPPNSIELTNNKISAQGFRKILKLISNNPQLEKLTLVGYKFNVKIVKGINQILSSTQPNLIKLDISYNRMNSGVLKVLIKDINPSNSRLTEINLNRNPLGSDGGVVASFFYLFPLLTALKLRECHLGDEGVMDLVKCVPPRRVIAIDASMNIVQTDTIQKIIPIMEDPDIEAKVKISARFLPQAQDIIMAKNLKHRVALVT